MRDVNRRPYLLAALVAAAGVLIVTAAGCDQNGDGSATSPAVTATAEPSPEASPSPTATLEPSPAPTVTPPPGVRLAVLPTNYSEFLESLGAAFTVDACVYDGEAGLVDCGQLGLGKILLDPPFPSDRAECGVHAKQGKPLAVNCKDPDTYRAELYEVLP